MKLDCLPIEDMRLDDIKGSSLYGQRIHPITKKPSFHCGIDRSTPTGTPLYAVFDGVIYISKLQGGGKGLGEYITIKSNEWYALYAHLSKRMVKNGDVIKAGQFIGYSGNTGGSTGSHLHFGVCKNYCASNVNKSDWVNPMPLLEKFKYKEEVKDLTNLTREEAKKIIKEACGFDDNTMAYLDSYIWRDSMLVRLAEAIGK